MGKFIIVTGGVITNLGKGTTAASLGRLLKNRGVKVTMQKFNPYLKNSIKRRKNETRKFRNIAMFN